MLLNDAAFCGRTRPAVKDEKLRSQYERSSERPRCLWLGLHAGGRWNYCCGAVDFSRRVAFYDITPAGTINFVSSSATDTHVQIQVAGRDSSGVVQTPAAVTLNGNTPVSGSQSFERLLYGVVSGASPNGPLSAPTGGADTTLSANITSSATSMTVTADTNFPSSGNY